MNDKIDWTIVWYHNKIKRSYYRDNDGKVICRKKICNDGIRKNEYDEYCVSCPRIDRRYYI